MYSVMFEFVDKDWDTKVSIWSLNYFHKKIKTSQQLIRMLWITHTEEDWKYFCDCTAEELTHLILNFMKENELKVDRPN